MAYRFVPFPMIFDDLQGHLPVQDFKMQLDEHCATFHTVSTDTARRAVPRRYLIFLFVHLFSL